jgi:hypothetical protein
LLANEFDLSRFGKDTASAVPKRQSNLSGFSR